MLLEALARIANMSEARLQFIAESASRRYKSFDVPKRSGGVRTIHHPSRELKAIQRWLSRSLFSRFPVHKGATAYSHGSSIRANAARHQFTNFTNRYDFSDFFPSFRRENVELFLNTENAKYGIALSDSDIEFVGKIVSRDGRLTIGAPSSPIVTNVMMYNFDDALSTACLKRDLIYTRYADDIFVSSYEPDLMSEMGNIIEYFAGQFYNLQLNLNRSKSVFLSRKFRRNITGVTVTSDRRLSIGRERKREIRALIHQWINGQLDTDREAALRGMIAFAFDVEPSYEVSLRQKYGSSAIISLLRRGEPTMPLATDAGSDEYSSELGPLSSPT